MRSPLKLVALVALIALVGPGCATFATKTEYCVFRELSETHDIVELAHYYRRYTTEFPDGVYSEQVAAMRPDLERLIAKRPKEEVDGAGVLRLDYAWHRLQGAAAELRKLSTLAKQAGACDLMHDSINEVLELCLQAMRAAEPHRRGAVLPPPAAWATAPVRQKTVEPPDFLKDI